MEIDLEMTEIADHSQKVQIMNEAGILDIPK